MCTTVHCSPLRELCTLAGAHAFPAALRYLGTPQPLSRPASLSLCYCHSGSALESGKHRYPFSCSRFLNNLGKKSPSAPSIYANHAGTTHMICAAGLAFTLIHYLLNSTGCLSSSASHHLTNRVRHSCACGCDSEEGAQAMEERPQEDPGLGDVRGGSVARCGWRGIQRTGGSSQQKNTWTVGCPARPFGAWSWAAVVGPG